MEALDNLRRLGEFDITDLRAYVNRQDEEAWLQESYRQQAFRVHRQTHTIYLVFDADFRHLEPTRHPKYEEFSEPMRPLIEKVSSLFDYQGWMVRCILTRLIAKGQITPHADQGFSLEQSHRIHIPIVTNEGVLFQVGEESVHMKAGELWEINNRRVHSVVNHGDESRVHMILDWAEPMTHTQLRGYRADRERHMHRARMGTAPRYD